MDASRDRTAERDRIDEIRGDIEGIRFRIAATIDALVYKADVPSRLADVLSSTASAFAARFVRRFPRPEPRAETALPSHPAGAAATDVETTVRDRVTE
jgi:hypothetical protein